MKYESQTDWAQVVLLLVVGAVALVGIVCMSLERIEETREAIKAGLVQDSNGRWVNP